MLRVLLFLFEKRNVVKVEVVKSLQQIACRPADSLRTQVWQKDDSIRTCGVPDLPREPPSEHKNHKERHIFTTQYTVGSSYVIKRNVTFIITVRPSLYLHAKS